MLSFEAEIEALNLKVDTLSKDLANRRMLETSGEDISDLLQKSLEEKAVLENQLQCEKDKLLKSSENAKNLHESEQNAREALLKEREILAVMRASSNRLENNVEAQETVNRLQAIWSSLGVESDFRIDVTRSIERSLEEACLRELSRAESMKTSCEIEILHLRGKRDAMKRAMGISDPREDSTANAQGLLPVCESLKQEVSNLNAPYRFSVARREKILKELKLLMPVLGVAEGNVDSHLQTLLQGEQPKERDGKITLYSHPTGEPLKEAFMVLPPGCLDPKFLSLCESGTRKLRVQKSVALVRNRELQQQISDLIDEMHLGPKDSLELIHTLNGKNHATSAQWWDEELVNGLLRDIAIKKFISDPSETISNHLECLRESFTRAASTRRSISVALKSVIENAQKTLLDIVGREFDASEAYAGFHDALFRLPELSQDLILSCISEMEALIEGMDSMTQSEIEALTVIWEALKIPASDRRNFWGQMEKTDSKHRATTTSLLTPEVTQQLLSGEEWIAKAANRALEVYSNLKQKLQKLEGIHKEVERLRSKQDVKSKILSLDSEIRIMNAKLLDFEEHCNKQRLLSKKTSGGALLKEERFRKQMQSKFVTNLRQLAGLLQTWEAQEEGPFDASLLSEDVRTMLQNPDQMESWVEERTKFMGLTTVKAHTPNKRPFAAVGKELRGNPAGSKRQTSDSTPPRKRRVPHRSTRPSPPREFREKKQRVDDGPRKQQSVEGKKEQTLHNRDPNTRHGQSENQKGKRRGGSNSLRPFENILSEMASPR